MLNPRVQMSISSPFGIVSIRYQIDTKNMEKRYLLDTKHLKIRYQIQKKAKIRGGKKRPNPKTF